MTFKPYALLVNHCETGVEGFDIGNAVGIEAFYDGADGIGYFNQSLFQNLEIPDFNNAGLRGNKGNFIKLLGFEEFVAYLDDSLTSEFFTLQVGAK